MLALYEGCDVGTSGSPDRRVCATYDARDIVIFFTNECMKFSTWLPFAGKIIRLKSEVPKAWRFTELTTFTRKEFRYVTLHTLDKERLQTGLHYRQCAYTVQSASNKRTMTSRVFKTSVCQHKFYPELLDKKQTQSKAVPLHAMVALGGRGDIAPTHSWPRH
jgi:hypothetical protein